MLNAWQKISILKCLQVLLTNISLGKEMSHANQPDLTFASQFHLDEINTIGMTLNLANSLPGCVNMDAGSEAASSL